MSTFATTYVKPDEGIDVNVGTGTHYTGVHIGAYQTLHFSSSDGWTPELVAQWFENIAAQVREAVQ